MKSCDTVFALNYFYRSLCQMAGVTALQCLLCGHNVHNDALTCMEIDHLMID